MAAPLEAAIAGQVEAAVDRGRERRALLALWAQPRVEVRLVPDRPDVHVRVVLAGGLGEQAELLGAWPHRARTAPAVGRPGGRVAPDAEVGLHALRDDRRDRGVVAAPGV